MTVDNAYKLGAAAYLNGKKCVPAFDSELMASYAGLKIGEGVKFSEAWHNGWNSEHNKATKVDFNNL